MSTAGPPSLIGRVLDGRYRVLSHLADGGMATVYIGLDLRLERNVAVKVMRADLAKDESFVGKFRREARSAAKLSHPNVVAVYDQGEDDGYVFLAMELVNGLTLRQVMESEGPLTLRGALDIIDPVLQALGAAHAAGLIHRDVKPENVILREDGTVKVADFGLARAITGSASTVQTGVLIGTVAYLSPEQVERGTSDARSDVYAAGLLLFEMLTGSKAFIGDSPIHVAYQHVNSEVPKPSSRVDTVPARLDKLVTRASARQPDDRPRDANELLAEVREARQTLSVAELDRPPGRAKGASLNPTIALPRIEPVPSGISPMGPPGSRWRAPRLKPGRRRSGSAALLALVLASAAALWFFTVGPGAMAAVPRLAGSSSVVAQRTLAVAHLGTRVIRTFHETVKPGVVLATDPPTGREVRRGSFVTLTVSRGPERFDVPLLVGRTRAEAEQRLTDALLTPGQVSERFSESVPQGQIISTKPAANTSVKRSSPVALVISKGREPITIQDWTGQLAQQAVKALTAARLSVDATKTDWNDTVPKGSVVSQSPAAGTLFQGDRITLVVSRGPQLVAVPNVVSQQEGNARQILEDLGFDVQIKRVFRGFFRTVRLQSIPPGTRAPRGSAITLTVV